LAGVQIFTQKITIVETNQPKQGVCHTVALPFTLKSILMEKKELWKLKYLTMQKIIF
jgi:hypothetical protein